VLYQLSYTRESLTLSDKKPENKAGNNPPTPYFWPFPLSKFPYTMLVMAQPTIENSPNPAQKAGEYISDLLSTHIDKPVLLMLAGGSAREVLDFINAEYLTPEVTVTVTDERYTDDMGENNFDMLQTTKLYQNLMSADSYCINTSVVGGDVAYDESNPGAGAEAHAMRFERHIREWMQDFEKTGTIIGLFGMGADGHTAGIIPGLFDDAEFEQKFLGESDVAVVPMGKDNPGFQFRVTTTLSFMKKIHYPLFYITGEAKLPALRKALDPATELSEIPARIMLDMKSPVIFTDIPMI
jgi:6-phosphogluconolactonase/glucosamine-6-phosphate isomerase/deaminase